MNTVSRLFATAFARRAARVCLAFAVLLPFAHEASAQSDDLGTDVGLEVEKKLARGLSASLEGNYRTQDDCSQPERWSVGAGISYRLFQSSDKKFNVKANAGFEYIWQYNMKSVEPKTDAYDPALPLSKNPRNETAAYWRGRHRSSLGFSANYAPSKRWDFQLKETFQYSHYNAKNSVARTKWRYNDDDDLYSVAGTKRVKSKDRVVLRNRLSAGYDIKGLPLTPYAAADLGVGINYNAFKQKYTAGIDFKAAKQHRVGVFYRFQTENDDDEPNGHLLGCSYKFSF